MLVGTWRTVRLDLYVRHDSFIFLTWLIRMFDMTHSYVRHDMFICVTWRIHMCDMKCSYMWYDVFTCATWHIHTCDMTHSHVWHDAFTCVTWRIHMCDMTYSHVWHDVWHDVLTCATCLIHMIRRNIRMRVTWLIHMCAMTHSYVCHDSFICAPWLIHMCAMTHSYVWHGSFMHGTTHSFQLWILLLFIATHCNTVQHTATWLPTWYCITHCITHCTTHCNKEATPTVNSAFGTLLVEFASVYCLVLFASPALPISLSPTHTLAHTISFSLLFPAVCVSLYLCNIFFWLVTMSRKSEIIWRIWGRSCVHVYPRMFSG